MEALAAGHDAAVQMIDTSVVRVHQHGARVSDDNHQDMVAREGARRARSTRSWTPMACRSISLSRPVRRVTLFVEARRGGEPNKADCRLIPPHLALAREPR